MTVPLFLLQLIRKHFLSHGIIKGTQPVHFALNEFRTKVELRNKSTDFNHCVQYKKHSEDFLGRTVGNPIILESAIF